MALDVFDNDDGVVDHQACSESNAEQGQRVDGEAEQLDEREGADERDRNRDRGDDGGAPVLEENEDYQNDKEDGRAEGRDYVADGFADRVSDIEGNLILHAARKGPGEAPDFDAARRMSV